MLHLYKSDENFYHEKMLNFVQCFSLPIFKQNVWVFLILIHVNSLYILNIEIYGSQIFSPIACIAFSFYWLFLLLCKSFLVWCSPTCLFLLLLLVLLVYMWKFPPMCSSRASVVLVLTFKSVIHFEFILMSGIR